jgi:hypothetical protein
MRDNLYVVCALIFVVQSWKVDVQTPQIQLTFQCDADVNLTRGPSYSSWTKRCTVQRSGVVCQLNLVHSVKLCYIPLYYWSTECYTIKSYRPCWCDQPHHAAQKASWWELFRPPSTPRDCQFVPALSHRSCTRIISTNWKDELSPLADGFQVAYDALASSAVPLQGSGIVALLAAPSRMPVCCALG